MALAREHFKKRSRPQRRPDDAGEASVRERILSAALAAFMERGYSGASTLEMGELVDGMVSGRPVLASPVATATATPAGDSVTQ
jgi:hypothetical protein